MLERGLQALRWLTELQMSEKGHFRPIGSNGFYRRGGTRANFDQQPDRGAGHGLGLSGSLSRHIGRLVVRAGAARLRLVHRLERSRPGTLLSRDRRLPRWVARRPRQWEPGRRIDAGLPALAGGDAAGAEHGDELSSSPSPLEEESALAIAIPYARSSSNAPPPSSSPTSRACFCGLQSRGFPARGRDHCADHVASRKTQSPRCSTKSPPNSPSGTRHLREALPGTLRTESASPCRPPRSLSERTAAVDRLLLSGRILAGIRRAVQSVHRSAPGPDRSARPARCGSFSACAPPAKGTFLPSRFGPASSIPINGSRCDTPTGFLTEPRQIPNPVYEKALFGRKLTELGLTGEFTHRVMSRLGESFALEGTPRQSARPSSSALPDGMTHEDQDEAQGIWMLARSNYEVQFQPDQDMSERILFPATPSQRNGIEDARFVRFQNDDGTHTLLRDLHRLRWPDRGAGTGGDCRFPPLSIPSP